MIFIIIHLSGQIYYTEEIILDRMLFACIIVYKETGKQKSRKGTIPMLEISNKTNLLEQKSYKYSLQDVAEPNLHRDVYSYGTIPKVAFNHRRVPMSMPEEIWITDTSLRDGQQSVEPYSVDQIVKIYNLTALSVRPSSLFTVRKTARPLKSAWSWI